MQSSVFFLKKAVNSQSPNVCFLSCTGNIYVSKLIILSFRAMISNFITGNSSGLDTFNLLSSVNPDVVDRTNCDKIRKTKLLLR